MCTSGQGVPARSIYEKDSMVRGHHIWIYIHTGKTTWTPVREGLPIEKEEDNQHHEHAVAAMKNGDVVHLPHSIASRPLSYLSPPLCEHSV